jgi:uncharacterized protein
MSPSAKRTIDTFDLARFRARIEGEIPLAQLPRLAESLANADGFVRYRIDGLIDDEGHPGARMHLQAQLPLTCQRCNGPLIFDPNRTTHFRFVRSEEELDALPIEDDDVDPIVGSHALDLHSWIEDEVILSLPLVPRHEQCSPPPQREADPGSSSRPNPFAELAAALKSGGSSEIH